MSDNDALANDAIALLRTSLKSQYHAGLAMLGDATRRCPDALWLDDRPTNAFWQVAYHALFFTHFYLQTNEAAFRPWQGHQGDVQNPDGIAGPPDPESGLPLIPRPYTKEEVLAYWRFCDERVDGFVDALDLTSGESGFWWYPIPKLEHQLVNLRHLGHHAGQLADRVRAATGEGVRWVGHRRRLPPG
jgi:hypothetical protein